MGLDGGKLKVKVWSLTTDTDEIITHVFATEAECYQSLQDNYLTFDDDPKFDLATTEGRGALIDELTERQGVVLYIEEHEVEVDI